MATAIGRSLRTSALVVGLLLAFGATLAQAQVVAIGASNTAGRGRGHHTGGVDANEAYPAQLERLLRARGINVTVRNAGVAGDTTTGMLARLDSVIDPGTRVVIIQPGSNDALRGGSIADGARNVAEMQRRLHSRGIKVIVIRGLRAMVPRNDRDPDNEHIDAKGHAIIAQRLLAQVLAALRR